MYIFDLQNKLRKLNEKLYIRTEERTQLTGGLYATGIYVKRAKRNKGILSGDKALVHTSQQKYLEALEKGELDHFVMGVCLNYVPEYDIFDLDRERLLMPGWRSILLQLANKELISLDKAKKVFKCRSLGTSDWDKLTFFQKLKLCRGDQ